MTPNFVPDEFCGLLDSTSACAGGEEALRACEELFRGAFEHTGVATALTNIENRFVRVNAAFAQTFGYSRAEMLRMTSAEITHPDDLPESDASRKALLAGKGQFFQ